MVNTDINKIISDKTIQLNFKDKLTYFGIAFYLLVFFVLILIGKLVDFIQHNILAVELIGLSIATVVLITQNKKLKFKSILANLTASEINSAIYMTSKELRWYLVDVGSNYTIATREGGTFPFSWEEQITIISINEKILINSLCDPDSAMITIFGKNKRNINTFAKNIIKQQTMDYKVPFDILNKEILI